VSHFTLQPPNGYCLIRDSYFPRQQIGKKVFLSKMFLHGNGNGRDLTKWLAQGWPPNPLDHVWSCKTCQGVDKTYVSCVDSFYYKVMTIYMWYVIWRHGGLVCNVVKSKQGHGQ